MPPNDSVDLLAHCLNIPRNALFFSDDPISEEAFFSFNALLERRKKGEPLQQIIGFVEFLTCTIRINRDVLIPRQETELMTDYVIKTLQKDSRSNKILVDLCTGSGCIAIAIKKALPEIHVIGVELSEKALRVAEGNALLNNVSIEFLQGDFLSPLVGRHVDFVVSNPPYVSELEYEGLDPSVKLFEPRLALVGGKDGLDFYKRLADSLPDYLNRPAKVFLEIGASQGKVIKALFEKKPWHGVVIHKDLASHDRYFSLEIE